MESIGIVVSILAGMFFIFWIVETFLRLEGPQIHVFGIVVILLGVILGFDLYLVNTLNETHTKSGSLATPYTQQTATYQCTLNPQ